MEELQNKLFEAAAEGSVTTLQKLLQEDALILERDDYIINGFLETPAHVAAMLGHVGFLKEVVRMKPQLATELNSQQSTPLHLASAKGHVDVVRVLLSADPRACLARDSNGLTPLHLAALTGRSVEVINILLREIRDAAQLVVHKGENILHLCVKHYQLEALKLLLNNTYCRELLNAKDADGNTLLHLAVAYKQVKTIKLLLATHALDVNAQNLSGMTAVDVLIQSRSDLRDAQIQESLKNAGAVRALRGNLVDHRAPLFDRQTTLPLLQRNTCRHDWLDEKRSALMIVASLIATIAFQVGANPPGGVWQDDSSQGNSNSGSHQAGISILARNYPSGYTKFCIFNTVSFVSSLSIILLLMSGLPIRRRFFVWILMVITWIAITSTAICYIGIVIWLTPSDKDNAVLYVIGITVIIWMGLMALLLAGHTIRLVVKLVRKLSRTLRRRRVANPAVLDV